MDRLKKYKLKGNYSSLIEQAIAEQNIAITESMAKISHANYVSAVKKLRKPEQKFIIPEIGDVLKNQDLMIRKAKERGRNLTIELRDRLSTQLKDVLNTFTERTNEPNFLKRRGKDAGTINPKLVKEFEGKIFDTFTNYKKIDSKYGMPSNIHEIAVTEVRSVANNIKRQYMENFIQANPDYRVFKRWRHNKKLSKKFRPHHANMNGVTIPWEEYFHFSTGNRLFVPHDPDGVAEEVICCNCDYDVVVKKAPLNNI